MYDGEGEPAGWTQVARDHSPDSLTPRLGRAGCIPTLSGRIRRIESWNLRLQTWLGYAWSCANACVSTRRGVMQMGFEPSWSSGRTALCAKQRAPSYATHALRGSLSSQEGLELETCSTWVLA